MNIEKGVSKAGQYVNDGFTEKKSFSMLNSIGSDARGSDAQQYVSLTM